MVVKEKSDGLELVKALACVFVVILHAVANGGGIEKLRLYIYFLGTFGIPLFFIANGFALGKKTYSNKYLVDKIINYICFVIQWVSVIAIPVFIMTGSIRRVLSLAVGTIAGSGYLYALWFMPALCIVYFILIIRNYIFKNNDTRKPYLFVMTIFLLTVEYLINRLLLKLTGYEIRDILWPPFRVLISLGYFWLGVELKKFCSQKKLSHREIVLSRISVMIGLVYLLFEAIRGDMIWASSYYGSPFIVIACVGFFILCIDKEDSVNKKVLLFAEQITGIWIIHPFVIRVYNKFMGVVLPNFSTESCFYVFLRLILAISVSFLISVVMKQFKVTKRLVNVSLCKLKI